MSRSQTNQPGFTIIELITAIAITLLMGFLISRLFFDTANAVSRGMAVSKMLSANRTVSEQLQADAELMHPPNISNGGVLCIIHKTYTNVDYMDPRFGGLVDPTAPGLNPSELVTSVSSDQLMFIANLSNSELQPMTPVEANSYESKSTAADRARIWYGHVLRVDADGNAGTVDLGNASSADKYMTNWILGRQVLFFHDEAATLGTYYANGVTSGATVVGYSSPPPASTLYNALSDIVYFSYDNAAGAVPPLSAARQFVGSTTGNYFQDSMGRSAYRTQALELMYVRHRLRVRMTPSGFDYETDQIAQMHPALAVGVSDFIVEFAADAIDDDSPPDGIPDGAPDTDTDGNIRWYGATDLPVWEAHVAATYDPSDTVSSASYPNASYMHIWRHNSPDSWPYLIRIRYRMHDPNGELTDKNDSTGNVEPGKWFEQIIRVRRN